MIQKPATNLNSYIKARNPLPLEEVTAGTTNHTNTKTNYLSTVSLAAPAAVGKTKTSNVTPIPPVAPVLKGAELRERIIHILAVRDQNDYQIKVECKGKPNHIASCLDEVYFILLKCLEAAYHVAGCHIKAQWTLSIKG